MPRNLPPPPLRPLPAAGPVPRAVSGSCPAALALALLAACASPASDEMASPSTGGASATTEGSGASSGATAGATTGMGSGSGGSGSATEGTATTGGSPQTYPPIYILFNSHGHNYGFAQGAEQSPDFATLKAQRYQAHRAEVTWLRDATEAVGARMSFQLNGEYARDARLAGDAGHIAELPGRGHSVGTHFHRFEFSGANEFWSPYDAAEATFERVQKTWSDHIQELEMALGAPLLRVDGATLSDDPDSKTWLEDLRASFDVRIEAGGEALTYTEWNIPPWTPYRRKRGTILSEDPRSPIIALGGYPQVGLPQPQGLHALVTTVPQLERHFLMLLAEWREHERLGDPARIWFIAFMSHPDQNAAYRDEVGLLLDFLAQYTEAVTPRGTPIAAFASDTELRETFLAWESDHPGASSFDFDWEAHLGGDPQPYPYLLEGVTEGLKDCEVTGPPLATWADQDVVAHPLAHRDITRGPPNENGQRQVLSVGELGLPVYLLWSDAGAEVTIDFRSAVPGMVYVKDGLTGAVTMADAAALTVPEQPIVVSETDAYF